MSSPGADAAFIIRPMRFFVLMLLVLLLPLRGGMGEAMAAAGPHHDMTQQAHAHAEHALEDCAGHTGHTGPTQSTAQASTDSQAEPQTASPLTDCDACSACQTCHAVALVFSADEVQPMPAPHAAPAAASLQFASAPAARDQKPPIA